LQAYNHLSHVAELVMTKVKVNAWHAYAFSSMYSCRLLENQIPGNR